MVHRNYKWNISIEEGQNHILRIIKEILKEQKNQIIDYHELVLLMNNRSKQLTVTNNKKKKSLINFMNSNLGGLTQFIDNFNFLLLIDDGKGIKVQLNEMDSLLFNEWIYVE